MKDIYQLLREKEQAVARVRQEVEALRLCLPMLAETDSNAGPLQPPLTSPKPSSWSIDEEDSIPPGSSSYPH